LRTAAAKRVALVAERWAARPTTTSPKAFARRSSARSRRYEVEEVEPPLLFDAYFA